MLPNLKAGNGDAMNCRSEWKKDHSQHVLFEVVGGTDGKKDPSFLETLLVVHSLQWVVVPIGEAIKVPSSQP